MIIETFCVFFYYFRSVKMMENLANVNNKKLTSISVF